jgi:hypothetical protein
MRWFLGVTAALFLTWAGYMASPYVALWMLAGGIERGDAAAVSARVNIHALRASLARQVAAEELKRAAPAGQTMSVNEHQLAASALALLADPLTQRLLNPEGMLLLLQAVFAGQEPTRLAEPGKGAVRTGTALGQSPGQSAGIGASRIADIVGASRWRGFRNFYVTLPTDRPADARFRLQLRFSRLAWRLVAVDLPSGGAEGLSRMLARRVSNAP